MQTRLSLRGYIDLPPHPQGDFDHGDVYRFNGSIFVANTAAGTVEVLDGEHFRHVATLPDCPEASASTSFCQVVVPRCMRSAS